jgi:outer membrane murein-binding lipoprotein Lpp
MARCSIPILAAVFGAAVLLSGCSGQVGLKALDRASTPDDKLPAGVTLQNDMNADSVRLLATKDGVKYFAAENADATIACVAVVPPGDAPRWIAGCGSLNTSGRIVEVSGLGGAPSTTLVADGFDTRKLESGGWTKVADNILVSGH